MEHYTWIFSGIGVAILSGVVAFVLRKKRAKQSSVSTSVGQFRGIKAGGNISITISDSGGISQGTDLNSTQLPSDSDSTRITIYFCLYDGRKATYSPPDRTGAGSAIDSRLTARQLTTPGMLKAGFGIDVEPNAPVDLFYVEDERFLIEDESLSQAGVQNKNTLGIVIKRGNMTANMFKTMFSLQS